MAIQISNEQQSLHLKLKFLAAIKYSDLDQPSSRFRLSDTASLPKDRMELNILNIMAAYLTTGYLGDVVAVTFLHESFTFVIARNSPPGKKNSSKPQLREHTKNLMAALIGKGSPVEVRNAVLPIVVGYCEDNIIKRIKKLRASFKDFSIPPSAEDPESRVTNVNNALERIRSSGTGKLADNFCKLAACAYLLMESDFWKKTRVGAGMKIERTHRHLLKICQYSTGIVTLVTHLRKLGLQESGIHLCFVNEDAGSSIPPKLPSAEDVFKEITNPNELSMQKVYDKFSKKKFDESWKQGSGKIIIHAELQIIDFVDKERCSSSDMFIGISKRCCLCCALYIYYLNKKFHRTWRTSGCHGKAYENWALPGKYSEVDTDVIADVTKTLQAALDELVSHVQHSDDFASSQDEAMAKTLKEMCLADAALQTSFPVSHAEIMSGLEGAKICLPDATRDAQIRQSIHRKRMPSKWFVAVVVFGVQVGGRWFYRYSVEVSTKRHFGSDTNTQQIAFFDIDQSVHSLDYDFYKQVLKDCVSNAYSEGL